MRYQHVVWMHSSDDYPVDYFSEIGDDGFEVRRVDGYRDGHLDLAGENIETGKTTLAQVAMTSSVEEINADSEFRAKAITRREFEAVWRRALEWFRLDAASIGADTSFPGRPFEPGESQCECR